MKVKVTFYGETTVFSSAKKAIAYFREGMLSCDPYSSEYERYEMIVDRLQNGETTVNDELDNEPMSIEEIEAMLAEI